MDKEAWNAMAFFWGTKGQRSKGEIISGDHN